MNSHHPEGLSRQCVHGVRGGGFPGTSPAASPGLGLLGLLSSFISWSQGVVAETLLNQLVMSVCSAGLLSPVSVDLALHPHVALGMTEGLRIHAAASSCSRRHGLSDRGLCRSLGTGKKAVQGPLLCENTHMCACMCPMHAFRQLWEDALSCI